MKLIIAGSRHLKIHSNFIQYLIEMNKITNISMLYTGGARGVDRAGEEWAQNIIAHNTQMSSYMGPLNNNVSIEIKHFDPNWEKFGRAAGPMRNKNMAETADALLLIWDGESRGSMDMKEHMKRLDKPIYECLLTQPKKENVVELKETIDEIVESNIVLIEWGIYEM